MDRLQGSHEREEASTSGRVSNVDRRAGGAPLARQQSRGQRGLRSRERDAVAATPENAALAEEMEKIALSLGKRLVELPVNCMPGLGGRPTGLASPRGCLSAHASSLLRDGRRRWVARATPGTVCCEVESFCCTCIAARSVGHG